MPAADRQTDEEPFDLGTEADRVAALYADADQEDLAQGIYASLVNLYEHLARPAAVMADLGAAITEGVTEARLREVVAEGMRDVLAGCEEWPTGLELADAVLALPEMRALFDAAAKDCGHLCIRCVGSREDPNFDIEAALGGEGA